jgi:hypothetical protein
MRDPSLSVVPRAVGIGDALLNKDVLPQGHLPWVEGCVRPIFRKRTTPREPRHDAGM